MSEPLVKVSDLRPEAELKRAKELKIMYDRCYSWLDRSLICLRINEASAKHKHETTVYRHDLKNSVGSRELFETPQYTNPKSLIDRLKDLYPDPLEVHGYVDQEGYYRITISWPEEPQND